MQPGGLQLLSQLRHIDAQILIVIDVSRAPDVAKQLLVGQRFAPAGNEPAEDFEFLR